MPRSFIATTRIGSSKANNGGPSIWNSLINALDGFYGKLIKISEKMFDAEMPKYIKYPL